MLPRTCGLCSHSLLFSAQTHFGQDIYFAGTAPPYMRGREREEIHYYDEKQSGGKPLMDVVGVAQLGSNKETDDLGRMR